jgi:hypothetical protein
VEDIKERILSGTALLLSFSLAVFIWSLTIQSIGVNVNSTNKATIISGFLSMLGGMVGAFSAYLIARAQITTQLDLQDKKDRSRVLLETKLRKAEEVLEVLTRTKTAFFNLQGAWRSILIDYTNEIQNRLTEDIDYEELKNEGLLELLEKHRDDFVFTYSGCYKYRPYFPELIDSIERDHNETFKTLTVDINSVMFLFGGVEGKAKTYLELWRLVEEDIEQINANFWVILDKINMQIISTENKINHLLLDFNKE